MEDDPTRSSSREGSLGKAHRREVKQQAPDLKADQEKVTQSEAPLEKEVYIFSIEMPGPENIVLLGRRS